MRCLVLNKSVILLGNLMNDYEKMKKLFEEINIKFDSGKQEIEQWNYYYYIAVHDVIIRFDDMGKFIAFTF